MKDNRLVNKTWDGLCNRGSDADRVRENGRTVCSFDNGQDPVL